MRSARTVLGIAGVAAVCGLLACNKPNQRLNAPPHGEPYSTADMQGTFVYMNDNALLENMTVCDMHFLPHRSQLNSNGVERLSRLASLMESYGGSIRFDTNCTDEKLSGARLQTIRDFLAETGIDTTSEVVATDISGGEGMNASEAILIRSIEGTYQPKKAAGGAAPAPPPSSGKPQ